MRLRSFTAIYLRSESALGKFKLMWLLYIYKKSQHRHLLNMGSKTARQMPYWSSLRGLVRRSGRPCPYMGSTWGAFSGCQQVTDHRRILRTIDIFHLLEVLDTRDPS